MRQLLKVMCAAALAACSDSKAPTAIQTTPRVAATDTGAHEPTNPPLVGALDPRSPAQWIEDVLTPGLVKVRLPPDGFSQSADAVHPDIACPPESWNAARCWLMYTPYLNSDNAYENPGFLFAASDTSWATPPGVLNPIVPYPGIGRYNSDPDHAFDPASHRLVQIYRVVADSFNNIMIMSTADARQWTTPSLAFREKNHDAVSPALVLDPDRTARIWYVRAGSEGCQSKSSDVQLRTAQPDSKNSYEQAKWSAPTPVDLNLPNAVVWHLDVASLGEGAGYVALIAAYQRGLTCGNSDLWLATSPDGLHWKTYAIPILWRGMRFAGKRNIGTWYRGTLRYDAATDTLDLWPSALVGTNWTIYHAAVRLHDLLAALEAARPSDLRVLGLVYPSRGSGLRMVEMP